MSEESQTPDGDTGPPEFEPDTDGTLPDAPNDDDTDDLYPSDIDEWDTELWELPEPKSDWPYRYARPQEARDQFDRFLVTPGVTLVQDLKSDEQYLLIEWLRPMLEAEDGGQGTILFLHDSSEQRRSLNDIVDHVEKLFDTRETRKRAMTAPILVLGANVTFDKRTVVQTCERIRGGDLKLLLMSEQMPLGERIEGGPDLWQPDLSEFWWRRLIRVAKPDADATQLDRDFEETKAALERHQDKLAEASKANPRRRQELRSLVLEGRPLSLGNEPAAIVKEKVDLFHDLGQQDNSYVQKVREIFGTPAASSGHALGSENKVQEPAASALLLLWAAREAMGKDVPANGYRRLLQTHFMSQAALERERLDSAIEKATAEDREIAETVDALDQSFTRFLTDAADYDALYDHMGAVVNTDISGMRTIDFMSRAARMEVQRILNDRRPEYLERQSSILLRDLPIFNRETVINRVGFFLQALDYNREGVFADSTARATVADRIFESFFLQGRITPSRRGALIARFLDYWDGGLSSATVSIEADKRRSSLRDLTTRLLSKLWALGAVGDRRAYLSTLANLTRRCPDLIDLDKALKQIGKSNRLQDKLTFMNLVQGRCEGRGNKLFLFKLFKALGPNLKEILEGDTKAIPDWFWAAIAMRLISSLGLQLSYSDYGAKASSGFRTDDLFRRISEDPEGFEILGAIVDSELYREYPVNLANVYNSLPSNEKPGQYISIEDGYFSKILNETFQKFAEESQDELSRREDVGGDKREGKKNETSEDETHDAQDTEQDQLSLAHVVDLSRADFEVAWDKFVDGGGIERFRTLKYIPFIELYAALTMSDRTELAESLLLSLPKVKSPREAKYLRGTLLKRDRVIKTWIRRVKILEKRVRRDQIRIDPDVLKANLEFFEKRRSATKGFVLS